MKNNRRTFIKSLGLASWVQQQAYQFLRHAPKSKMEDGHFLAKNFPGLGAGAETLASYINQLSGGSLKVKVFGANELVPLSSF